MFSRRFYPLAVVLVEVMFLAAFFPDIGKQKKKRRSSCKPV
jgi:hypothetical protein